MAVSADGSIGRDPTSALNADLRRLRDPGALATLREHLVELGFSSRRIHARLGLDDSSRPVVTRTARCSLVYGPALAASQDALHVTTALLLLGRSVERHVYRRALPDSFRDVVEHLGLVALIDNHVRATFSVTEYDGVFLLSDQLFQS